MIKIAVCDDMPDVCSAIRHILLHHFDVEVDTYINGMDLIQRASSKRYDIVFIDIELSQYSPSGIEVAKHINSIYSGVLIIFFTGLLGYEDILLQCQPFRFLRKPFSEKEIVSSTTAAIERLNGWENNFFRYRFDGIVSQVPVCDIVLFVSQSPHIHVHTLQDDFVFRGKMDDVESNVRSISNYFVRVSKSYLLNKNFIEHYSSREIFLLTGDVISVGRRYANSFLDSML